MPSRRSKEVPVKPLPPDRLRPTCDPETLAFRLTDELEPLDGLIGQERALGALRFGTEIGRPGFNLFALGSQGSGRHRAVRAFIKERAAGQPAPDDWVYVNNFQVAHKPRALRLPAGTALRFRDAMRALIDDLRSAVPALFDSDDYRARRRTIDEAFQENQEGAFEALREKAEAQGIGIIRTPMGFALAPMREGQVVKPEAFHAMPEAERREIEDKIEALQKELAEVLQKLPFAEKERRDNIRRLHAQLASMVISAAIAETRARFADVPAITEYLADAQSDLVDNVEIFIAEHHAASERAFPVAVDIGSDPGYRRYAVNVLVGSDPDGGAPGAPLVGEDNPTLANLVGRMEHVAHMGALLTDFTMIRPGALHRANGGYLLLDARKVLTEPFAWDALKRTLRSGAINIVSPAEQLSLVSTVSLEPEAIPLDLKVVLIGERLLYYLLTDLDPEFSELFKVQVDFSDEFERSKANVELYARLIGGIARNEGLRPLDASAAARVIDEAARLAEDAERISLRIGPVADLLREADFWAAQRGRKSVTAEDVEQAVRERETRADRLRARALEQMERGIVLIDTDGEAVGQVNGLSVLSLGNYSFGRPSRITARVRMGTGKVVDIERETKLGGPLHSKGVLILSSFLSARYASDMPMSLWASLVFEQSYGGVDGDSASSAELYALLSALAGLPIRQALAVTGSVNQLGEVQAIGGVNEKIEGFFDICAARGLTGQQGALIPAANAVHLMLRKDVVEACAKGRFHVFPIRTIDEGIELLTGIPAGAADDTGAFPEGSINALVDARLRAFARARHEFAATQGRGQPQDEQS